MRIAHVVDTMQVGGAEVLVASLCRFQRETGHDPRVYCMYSAGPLGERLRREGIPVVVTGGAGRAARMRRLLAQFAADQPEAAHFHNAGAAIFGVLPAARAGVPRRICTRHGLVGHGSAWKQELQFAAAAWLCHNVVAVCRPAEQNLRRRAWGTGGRVVTVYNGCLPALRTGQKGLFPAEAGWRVLQVGRLSEPKEPACLIQAAGLLRQRIPGLAVTLVGDGPLLSQLEEQVERSGLQSVVHFAGAQQNIGDWLDEADAFVLASRSEGVPVSVLEALEAGLPVVASAVGGIPDVLPPGGLSVAVRPSDAPALAEALAAVYESRQDAAQRRNAVREFYLARFTLERMAAAYERLYRGEPLPADDGWQ